MLLMEPTILRFYKRWSPARKQILRWLVSVLICLMSSFPQLRAQDQDDEDLPETDIPTHPLSESEVLDIAKTLEQIDQKIGDIQTQIAESMSVDTDQPMLSLNLVHSETLTFRRDLPEADENDLFISMDAGGAEVHMRGRAPSPSSKLQFDHWTLFRRAVHEYKLRRRDSSQAQLEDQLKEGIEGSIDGVGEYKVTQVAGIVGVRTLVEGSQLAVLHVNVDEIMSQPTKAREDRSIAEKIFGVATPEYNFASVWSRQLMVSQRDLVIANRPFVGRSVVQDYSYYRRPSRFTAEWFAFHWKSIRGKPNNGDLLFGPMFATTHSVGVTAMIWLSSALNGQMITRPEELITNVAAWTLAFGTMVGINQTTYRNLMNSGKTQTDRIVRSLWSSVLFAAGVAIAKWLDGSSTPTGELTPYAVIGSVFLYSANVIFNQFTKDEFATSVRSDSALRVNIGTKTLFGVEYKVANMQSNIVNLQTMFLKMGSLMNLKIQSFPIGNALYYSFVIPRRKRSFNRQSKVLESVETALDELISALKKDGYSEAKILKDAGYKQLRYNQQKAHELYVETKGKWLQVRNIFYRIPYKILTHPTESHFRNHVVRKTGRAMVSAAKTIKEMVWSCSDSLKGSRPDSDEIEYLFPAARVNHMTRAR